LSYIRLACKCSILFFYICQEYAISSTLYWYSSFLSCSCPINKFKSSKLSEWILMSISIMKECYIPMWSWMELMPLCACLFILRWNQIVCSNCLCGYSQTRWLDNDCLCFVCFSISKYCIFRIIVATMLDLVSIKLQAPTAEYNPQASFVY